MSKGNQFIGFVPKKRTRFRGYNEEGDPIYELQRELTREEKKEIRKERKRKKRVRRGDGKVIR